MRFESLILWLTFTLNYPHISRVGGFCYDLHVSSLAQFEIAEGYYDKYIEQCIVQLQCEKGTTYVVQLYGKMDGTITYTRTL